MSTVVVSYNYNVQAMKLQVKVTYKIQDTIPVKKE